ncbi:hypothetical protein [Streptomyces roseochromogenus]|uniref:Uncharacterized protein n=1 Tax=Streptomyces roseochromogenus subsp. oscitans DS 12.976 TaxID=1352936 RepID=V6KH91_STRRC|nr:hypothetical protein [Streptomyces roseochromogenus]EST28364.1 hypothetical protein M878_22725 [Streptomyces roseochromogenus subsp. oscitans DS 12.976]
MSQDQAVAMTADSALEKVRARYGLLAVVISNLAIAAVAIFGVWRLHGDTSVTVGILTAAFTAVSSMTTAYLGIKAVSSTAKSIALGRPGAAPASTPPTATPPTQRTP